MADWYADLLRSAQQDLVRMPDGTLAPAPVYGQATSLDQIYGGILPLPAPAGGIPPIGVAGTKNDRGTGPKAGNSLTEPWPGAYDQVAYRSGRNDIIQNIPYSPPLQTAAGTVDATNPLNANNVGMSFFGSKPSSAESAIAQATTPLPRLGLSFLDQVTKRAGNRKTPALPTMPDPLLEEIDPWGTLRTPGQTAKPRPGLVTGTPGGVAKAAAAAPQGGGGLLGLLLGALGGGQSGGSGGGLAAILSGGGHDTSSPAAFAADVTRPSNIPGVQQFTGKVEMGSGGQNRYGSTAANELYALYGR